MKNIVLRLILTFTIFSPCAKAQQIDSSKDLFSKEYHVQKEDTLRYRMLLPKNFDESKQYPLVLFLHGAGERGSDNKKQLAHGSSLFLNENVNTLF